MISRNHGIQVPFSQILRTMVSEGAVHLMTILIVHIATVVTGTGLYSRVSSTCVPVRKSLNVCASYKGDISLACVLACFLKGLI